MLNDTILTPKHAGYYHDPYVSDVLKRPLIFDNDLLLFSASSEALGRVSFDRISVIGGRSSDGLALPGRSFSEIISLADSEKELLVKSLYVSSEAVALIPLGNKVIAVYNQLLRSNGLGIAFIFDYSPGCVSYLIKNEAFDTRRVLISSTFRGFDEKEAGSAELLSSFSRALEKFKNSDAISRFSPSGDLRSILDVVNASSDLIGCPISVEIGELSSGNLSFDRPTLMAFILSLLSMARRLSKDRKATVNISQDRFPSISSSFILYSSDDIQSGIHEVDFCDRMASEMGIPFSVEFDGDVCRASFIPYRADPSALGFKAGIFINGKKLVRSL